MHEPLRDSAVFHMLSNKAIDEFKEIYHSEYGTRITDAEALELGINLLILFVRVYRPIPRGWDMKIGNIKNRTYDK